MFKLKRHVCCHAHCILFFVDCNSFSLIIEKMCSKHYSKWINIHARAQNIHTEHTGTHASHTHTLSPPYGPELFIPLPESLRVREEQTERQQSDLQRQHMVAPMNTQTHVHTFADILIWDTRHQTQEKRVSLWVWNVFIEPFCIFIFIEVAPLSSEN